jgi:hypothetical protein
MQKRQISRKVDAMKHFVFHPTRETPRERLLRMQIHATPFQRSLPGRPLALGLGLLLLVGALLVLGVLTGIYGADLMMSYVHQLILRH